MPNPNSRPQGQCKDRPWRCERCPHLLGYEFTDAEGNSHLRFKFGNLTGFVVEPKVIGIQCPKCSWVNVLRTMETVAAPTPEPNEQITRLQQAMRRQA